MLMRFSLFAILVLLGFGLTPLRAADIRWACYYADTAKLETLMKFDLLVLDSAYPAPLSPLADAGKTLIGYLSVGEVASTRPYFDRVKTEGILLEENRNWKGSFFVDVRDQRWTKRVVEDLIPEILRKGFHGIFLDTVDNAAYENQTLHRGGTEENIAELGNLKRLMEE